MVKRHGTMRAHNNSKQFLLFFLCWKSVAIKAAQVCNVFLVSGEYGVPNGSLTASSSLAPGHAPMYGRLNTSFVQGEHFGGWAPQSASNQFIQVQLNGLSSIQGVATQGRNVTNESQDEQFFFRVTKYEVAYSLDGLSWSTVMNPNMTAKAFQGNTDQNSIHVNWFPCIFEARYVRIHPTEWNIFPTLRFDIIGCPAFAANDSSDCGFENGICGWNQRNENETAVWKTLNGSNASSGQLPYRGHTCTNGTCTYAYLSPMKETGNAVLWRIIRESSAPRCLHVWSTGLPRLNGLLNVSVIGCENQTNSADSRLVRNFIANWTRTLIDVAESDHTLIIEGTARNDGNAYLVIDDISLQTGKCTDCGFDANLCNWANNGTSGWAVLTAGSRTCAVAQGNGHAVLVSPLIYSGNTSRALCLTFTYTISGSDENTLNVSAKPINQSLWRATTAGDGVWRTVVLDVQENDTFQVLFESTVVLGYVGVDDIAIYYDGCDEVIQSSRAYAQDAAKSKDGGNTLSVYIYIGIALGLSILIVILIGCGVHISRRAKHKNHTENNQEHDPTVQIEISQDVQSQINQGFTTSYSAETAFVHKHETVDTNYSQASHLNAGPSETRKYHGQKYRHYDPKEGSFGYNPPNTHAILCWIAASELNGQSVAGDVPYDYILDGHTRPNVAGPNNDRPGTGRTSVEINPVLRVTDMAHYNLAADGNLYSNNPDGNFEKQKENEASIQIGSDNHYLMKGCMYTSVIKAKEGQEKIKKKRM